MAAKKKKSRVKKGKSSSKSRKAAKRASPVPSGFGTVTPYLVIKGAADAIEFYKKAFGAKEINRQPMPDGRLMHASIRIGDSTVLLSDEFEGSDLKAPASAGTTTVTMHVYSKDVDKLWQRAIDAGAKVAMPLENQFWGERYGQLTDPFGHRWSLSMQVKMDKEEMEAKHQQAMSMFAQGEHPGREQTVEPAAVSEEVTEVTEVTPETATTEIS